MNGMRLAAVLLVTVAATPALALASADEAKRVNEDGSPYTG
jgi:hypothetical protein